MKKWMYGAILVIMLMIGGIFMFTGVPRVDTFELSAYEEILLQFKSFLDIGHTIGTREDAIEVAGEIWRQTYGYGTERESLQHYDVSYDAKNEAWLVTGWNEQDPKNLYIGGNPYLIVKKSGEILAVWHTK